ASRERGGAPSLRARTAGGPDPGTRARPKEGTRPSGGVPSFGKSVCLAWAPARRQGDQALSLFAAWAMADFLFAAWLRWMTPLDTALSRSRLVERSSSVAWAWSPASTAPRNLRIEVRSAERTAWLRCRAFSLVRLRLIWDLMFATRKLPLSRLA